ncbi:MAG: hypothetical protein KC649_08105, partial [Candidatus Omnitrophica bacterium]|nr:hypothetical protein [Candidatus Omnitrophota bacterium]
FLTKGTTYCAVIFVITSITLGILTSHRSQSVLESAKIKPLFSQNSTADLDTLKAQVAKQLDEAKSKMDAESKTTADKVSAEAETMSKTVSAGATAAE